MRAGDTVLMKFPGDSLATPVPIKRVAEAKAAGAQIQRRPLSTGQNIAKSVANSLPTLGGFTGGIIGGGGAAAATEGLAALPGIAAGSAVGQGLGAAGQMALYKAAGIPFDERLGPMAAHVGMNTAVGGGLGVLQGLTGGLAKAAAPGAMKSAIGNALPGAEDEMLAAKEVLSNKRMAALNSEIRGHHDAVQTAIDAATTQGKNFMNPQILLRALRGLRNNVSKADLPSRATENAVDDALKTTLEKVGPKTSPIVAPARGSLRANSPIVTPAQPLSPRQLENANKFAQDEVAKLFDARKANTLVDPSAQERAYQLIEKVTRTWLKRLPDVAKENAAATAKIARRDVMFEALKRKPPTGVAAGTVVGSLGYGASHGDPRLLALGIPAGAIQHMAGSPEAMSRLALFLDRPDAARILSTIPRGAVLGANEMGIGAPPDATRRK